MSRSLPVAAQGGGLVAVLVGVFLLLPLGVALVVAGALVVAAGTVAEIVQGRPTAPSVRRSRPQSEGAE